MSAQARLPFEDGHFSIRSTVRDDATVLALRGVFETPARSSALPRGNDTLMIAIAQVKTPVLIFDASEVRSYDSLFVGTLVSAVAARVGQVGLIGAGEKLRKKMESTLLATLLPLYGDEIEARRALIKEPRRPAAGAPPPAAGLTS